MRWRTNRLCACVRSFTGTNRGRELSRLRFHLQNQIDEYIAGGMDAQEARHAAFRSLAGVEQAKLANAGFVIHGPCLSEEQLMVLLAVKGEGRSLS